MKKHVFKAFLQPRYSQTERKGNALAQMIFAVAALFFVTVTFAKKCPGTPRTINGTVYCDNKFTLWVNGQKVATDPVEFTPHQAVQVEFEWNGTSNITYAIQCEDYASDSGYEYIESGRPQLGDGALIAEFDDGMGTVTSASSWRVYIATFGPTDASLLDGCSSDNLSKCVVEALGTPEGWIEPSFDDSKWKFATAYSAAEAGWGRRPIWSLEEGCCTLTSPADRSELGCDKTLTENQCLDPRLEFMKSSAGFIWASDLERDNRVLFRHTAVCEGF